jgi:cobalt/nickel transport system permease protein
LPEAILLDATEPTMHLGNGALTPECAALALGAAGIGLAAAAADVIRVRREQTSRPNLALAFGLGTLVFAAQAWNVPVLPGVSAHLVGGVLLAWMLGPGLGAWTMAVVLALQAVLLGDGGITSLGANILNMALLPAGSVYACRKVIAASANEAGWKRVGLASLLSAAAVVLAAAVIPLESALFRSTADLAGWSDFATRMIVTHLGVGLFEGLTTLALLFALSRVTARATPNGQSHLAWRALLVTGALSLALAALAITSSSSLLDGYEASAQRSGMSWLLK